MKDNAEMAHSATAFSKAIISSLSMADFNIVETLAVATYLAAYSINASGLDVSDFTIAVQKILDGLAENNDSIQVVDCTNMSDCVKKGDN